MKEYKQKIDKDMENYKYEIDYYNQNYKEMIQKKDEELRLLVSVLTDLRM